MVKYKISYIFGCRKDINDIFIEVLTKEIKKYREINCSKNKKLSCEFSFLEVD